MEGWQITGGTVTGIDHLNPIKFGNNQDAYHWIDTPDMLIAIVSDGCGSSPDSEVGAKVGSKVVAQTVRDWMDMWGLEAAKVDIANLSDDFMWEAVRTESINTLKQIAVGMCTVKQAVVDMGPKLLRTIKDAFLFTVVGIVLTDRVFVLFTIGDGFAMINGIELNLGEYPEDAPPYMMYTPIIPQLVDPTPELYKFRIHCVVPINTIDHVLIGSDGAKKYLLPTLDGDVSEFWHEDKYFINSDQVRRRLAVINKTNFVKVRGPLKDDTTLVVVRHTQRW